MKMAWRQIKIWGMGFTLPEIRITVQPLNPEVAERLKKHHEGMAECQRCHKFHNGRYSLSLITHLVDEHKVESELAIEIVEKLGRRTLYTSAERRAQAAVSASR